ncbi:MAG: hypothetical protein AB1556_08795 [Bacillota bacterium]
MARTYPEYDYDLPEGLFQDLGGLAVTELEKELAGRLEGGLALPALEEFFREYGQRVARAVLAAGEKYKDRTAEVMEEAARKTGLVSPGIPQRYIEIWLLATRPRDKWGIQENSTRRLTFVVNECSLYELIKESFSGEPSLPCQEICLTFLKELYKQLELDVQAIQLGTMVQNNICCFKSEFTIDSQ